MSKTARIAIFVAGSGLAVLVELLAGPHRLALVLPALAVSIAYLVLAALAPIRAETVLAAAVAVTWLAADVLPFTAFWHRAVLAQLILHVAWRGRLPSRASALVGISYALAVAWPLWTRDVASVAVGTIWGAAILAGCAIAPRGRRRAGSLGAAGLFAVGLVGSAGLRLAGGFEATYGAELLYDAALVATAAILLLAAQDPPVARLVDVVIRLGEPGTEVRDELAKVLGDPEFEIAYWDADRQAYLAPHGDAGPLVDSTIGRRVDLDGDRAALVLYGGESVDDSLVDEAVRAAVRAHREHARLEADARRRVQEVEESRHRIALADAAERARFGRELQARVADPLHAVEATVRDERTRELLALASEELTRLTAGLAPTALRGGLGAALDIVAEHAPVPVMLDIDPDTSMVDPATAACLYFACAEALANAVRHGDPGIVAVTLRRDPRWILTVRNQAAPRPEPPGGSTGSGLAGLRARAAALGGSLRAGLSSDVFELELVLPSATDRSAATTGSS